MNRREEIESRFPKAFEGYSYRESKWQDVLREALLNLVCGYYNCHSIKDVMVKAKLITPKTKKLTFDGKLYMYYAVDLLEQRKDKHK